MDALKHIIAAATGHEHNHRHSHRRHGVFAHYMVGGMEPHQAGIDVTQAQFLGLDAFALNVTSLEPWATNTIDWLFEAARPTSFKLFFSFDMIHFKHPRDFFSLIRKYIGHDSYYTFEGKGVVSTFWGGKMSFGHRNPSVGWQVEFKDALAAEGIETYFIPAFSDAEQSPHSFFHHYPALDGVMNWESWPWGEGPPSSHNDEGYFKSAIDHHKTFMMSISTHQYKHLSPHENWFRPGTLTLVHRMQQALHLSPHFLQIQTWNDAGESHYMGNVWPNSIGGSPCHAYIDDFPHAAWQILYRSFIRAFKAGAQHVREMRPVHGAFEGVFWYHPHLAGVSCADDMSAPSGREFVEDVVNVAIVVGDQCEDTWATVFSGPDAEQIASCRLKPGLNAFKAPGMRVGEQRVEIHRHRDGASACLAMGIGDVKVSDGPKVWNFNYAVVGLQQLED